MMRHWFRADLELKNIYEVTPEFLQEYGVKTVLSDLDNTIADYDTPVPNSAMSDWVKTLKEAGIGFAVVSNNCRERVQLFCKELEVPFFWRSAKPLRIQIWRAMKALQAKRKSTCLIGDKYITDICGARRAGILAIHVPSIKPRRGGKQR